MVPGAATQISNFIPSMSVDINFVQTEPLFKDGEMESDTMFEHMLPLEATEESETSYNLTNNNNSVADNSQSLLIDNSEEVEIVSKNIDTPDVNENISNEGNKGYENLNENDSLKGEKLDTEIKEKTNEMKEEKEKENSTNEVSYEEVSDENIARTINIPSYSGFKSYMSYKCFGSLSPQNRLQKSAVTEEGTGLRMVDGRYTIAVGYGVSSKIGQYVDLLLKNGTVISCIVGDFKAKADTDESNIFSACNCCSEFIVDMSTLNSTVRRMGDVSYMHSNWKSPVDKIIVYNTVY